MSLFESVKNAFADNGEPSQEAFVYRCVECGERFDVPKSQMISVRCPNCQSMNVRVVEG